MKIPVNKQTKQQTDKLVRLLTPSKFINLSIKWQLISIYIIIIFAVSSSFLSKAISIQNNDLVVSHQEYTHFLEDKKVRPWKKPDYQNQKSVLGASSNMLIVPEKLKENWQFWVDIYSQYSTQQGVLHDSLYPHLVYEVIDFSAIQKDPNLTESQRISKRREIVKARKKHIKETILSLPELKNIKKEKWSLEQRKLWTLFERIEDPKKYKKAATKRRMRFQLGQKDRFLYGIFYSGRYLEDMESIFKKANLPLQLTRLPFVESSFNLSARSKVGASGIWQFMPRTGRQYMTVTSFVDERNDPITATRSAAKVLKHNFQRLKNWPLAITAYNFGLYGVRRLVKRRGTSDLVEIIDSKKRSRRFGFASANFYLSFLAAVFVEQNADKYFTQKGDQGPVWANRLDYETIQTPSPMKFSYLASLFNNNKDLTYLYNPHLSTNVRKDYWNIPKGTTLYLLKGTSQDFLQNIPKQVSQNKLVYKVKKSDTLLKIAKKFKISIQSLTKINKISNPNNLKIGQVLLIPDTYSKTYRVVKGDTFSKIARRFKVSFQHLLKANKISNPNYLKVGQVLLIPSTQQ